MLSDLKARIDGKVSAMEAGIVREDHEACDPQGGPWGWWRVGFRIGERVFWTGSGNSLTSGEGGAFMEAEAVAKEAVSRWNAARTE